MILSDRRYRASYIRQTLPWAAVLHPALGRVFETPPYVGQEDECPEGEQVGACSGCCEVDV